MIATAQAKQGLSDLDLDGLLDRHIFHFDAQCYGYCTSQRSLGSVAVYRCTVCGAQCERTLVQRFFEPSGGHPRKIPCYTESLASAQVIVEAMRQSSDITKVFYAIALSDQHSGYLSLETWLILRVQPCHIAVAALRRWYPG